MGLAKRLNCARHASRFTLNSVLKITSRFYLILFVILSLLNGSDRVTKFLRTQVHIFNLNIKLLTLNITSGNVTVRTGAIFRVRVVF